MKKIFYTLVLSILSISVLAQAPQSFNYQAVLRNDAGEPMASQDVTVKIDILQGSIDGAQVFSETHDTETNEFGLINLQIGSVQSLDAVDWGADEYFIEVSVDGTSMGTTQLLSVPYALHAGTAVETDPEFTAWDKSEGIIITEEQISDLQEYLTEETDPVFTSTFDFEDVQDRDLLMYDAVSDKWIKFTPHYLTYYEETDPIFEASPAAGIETVDIGYWDEAYLWGDHALEGYLTEVPPGAAPGEMKYWDGEEWKLITPGEYGQTLNICNNIPTWGECPPSVPVVNTGAITNIGETTATGSGTVVSEGSHVVTERGLIWATGQNPTIVDNDGKNILGNGEGTFTGELESLTAETLYYVRAYAINEAGTAYGNQVSFTTENATVFLPTVSTDEIENIGLNSATSGGNVTDNGGATVTARGIVWDTNSMPTIENNTGQDQDNDGGIGQFNSELSALISNTNYYVRAYAVNSVGVAYGEQKFFATLQDAALPEITTAEITGIEQYTAIGGGEITSAGDGNVLLRGVCWSTSPNPTMSDNHTEDGNALGSFTSNITGLESGTSYYVRAFASSDAPGIAYGAQVEFTTLSGPPGVKITSLNSGQPGSRTLDASVANDGGEVVTARGFVWSTIEEPTIAGDSNTEGDGIGDFTTTLTKADNLIPNTTYYIRAYATNTLGTGYSEQFVFHFWDYHDVIFDIDGNQYNTVIIGNQEWMAENLKTTSYRNGISITGGLSDGEWQDITEGAYAVYNEDVEMLDAYGLLYNWYAVNNENNLCPAGWKVPTDIDWYELTNFVGTINDYRVGNQLKSCRQVNSPLEGSCATSEHPRWNSHHTHYGTDEFGFSALPGGSRQSNGNFISAGYVGLWWSSTESDVANAWLRYLYWDYGIVFRSSFEKNYGLSVRCLRDN